MSLFDGLRHKLDAMIDFTKETAPEFDVFLHRRPTKIDLGLYAEHLHRHLALSDDVIALAYLYIVKLKTTCPQFQLVALNASRVLLTSVVLAYKFVFDKKIPLKEAAKMGGVPSSELQQMEAKFLEALDWDLHVSDISETKDLLCMDPASTADDTSESDDEEYFAALSHEANEEFSELSAFFWVSN